MKILQSSLFRAVCAIAVGALLISQPDLTVQGITVAIGVLFLISGAISCLAYWNDKRHEGENIITDPSGRVIMGGSPTFPVAGIGSLLLGFILTLMPTTFVKWVMYALGAIIILGAINQMLALLSIRRFSRVSGVYWVFPTLLLLAGLFVMIRPIETAATPVVIVAVCLMVYGVSECINALKIHFAKKQMRELQRQGYTPYEEVREGEEPRVSRQIEA